MKVTQPKHYYNQETSQCLTDGHRRTPCARKQEQVFLLSKNKDKWFSEFTLKVESKNPDSKLILLII